MASWSSVSAPPTSVTLRVTAAALATVLAALGLPPAAGASFLGSLLHAHSESAMALQAMVLHHAATARPLTRARRALGADDAWLGTATGMCMGFEVSSGRRGPARTASRKQSLRKQSLRKQLLRR